MKAQIPTASILIPTHNKALQLEIAVHSALSQTIHDIEILIIGDGVIDKTRSVIERLLAHDSRIKFLDFPKGPNHGETYRHNAINAAQSDAIFYLCDDDLLTRDHVSGLLALLEKFNFVQSLNGAVNPEGIITLYPGVLSDPETIDWIVRNDRRYNSVSLTGTAHSRKAYLDAGQYWEITPDGEWPDHHQWRRMLRTGKFNAATSLEMTALQFPTSEHGRHLWNEDLRLLEQKHWASLINAHDAQKQISHLVQAGVIKQLGDVYRQMLELSFQLSMQSKQILKDQTLFQQKISTLEEALQQQTEEKWHYLSENELLSQKHKKEISAIKSTISWRITRPLRYIRRKFKAN